MNYYKLISGQNVVGVISQFDFRKYQSKHNLMVSGDIDSAQYAEYHGVYYHDDWMKQANEDVEYTQVSVIRIEQEEYDALVEALETEEQIEIEEPEQPEIEIPEEETDETIEYVKEMKLKQISMACESAIIAGVDVELSDGEVHHFMATLEDQINLISLSSMAMSGENNLPYHADGELCKYYSAADILTIVSAMTTQKSFHTTYHNSLKAYVNSLDNIADISVVQYGMEIPTEYQSDILKQMLAQMEAQNEVAE